MSNEQLPPEVQLDSQDIEEDKATKDIEQEIEGQTLIDPNFCQEWGYHL